MNSHKTLSVLVVDDNGMFLAIAEEMLSGHVATAVKTAKEAIEIYKEKKPDITFLDIALPDGNGHDVLKEIRAMNPKAYVIMMTASRLREDVLKSMDEGAEGYITKPFSEEMVHECIKDYRQYQAKQQTSSET